MSPTRARTQTAHSRVKRTNHEATAPPHLCLPLRAKQLANLLTVRKILSAWFDYLGESFFRIYKKLSSKCFAGLQKPGTLFMLRMDSIKPLHIVTGRQWPINFKSSGYKCTYIFGRVASWLVCSTTERAVRVRALDGQICPEMQVK